MGKGKLSPKFIGSFEILERIGDVTYRLTLPLLFGVHNVHNVFYMSILWKYVLNSEHVIRYEPLYLKDDLTYEDMLVRVLNHKK